ncbi:hypothetical protein ROHU_027901 [Labeo rohita]|uniref:Uncharacterized protein n=1 Tax=Labeo rohita TaxID=84645 RepID=A0A498M4E9_LABRO|nr:hypothetical protein ROHU_027901 [Labeo rohita]
MLLATLFELVLRRSPSLISGAAIRAISRSIAEEESDDVSLAASFLQKSRQTIKEHGGLLFLSSAWPAASRT